MALLDADSTLQPSARAPSSNHGPIPIGAIDMWIPPEIQKGRHHEVPTLCYDCFVSYSFLNVPAGFAFTALRE